MYEPLKPETKEKYIHIWVAYTLFHIDQKHLGDLFYCDEDTISNAITWCANNRLLFSTRVLVEAAKECIERQLVVFGEDVRKVKSSKPVNWNAVIGLYRLTKDYRELLWQFQALIQNKQPTIVDNDAAQFQQLGAQTFSILESKRSMEAQVRNTIQEWTDEQQELFHEVLNTIEGKRDIKIKREKGVTLIEIKDIAKNNDEKSDEAVIKEKASSSG